MTQAMPYWFDAALFAALAFAITQLSLIGRCLMATQKQVDELTVQVVKINDEVKASAAVLKAELESVKEQLAAANVPAETVDLAALAAAIQAVDDINPDPEDDEEVPVGEPVVDPVEEPVVVEEVAEEAVEVVEDNPPF